MLLNRKGNIDYIIGNSRQQQDCNMHQDYQKHKIPVQPKKQCQQNRKGKHGKQTPKCHLAVVRNQRVPRPPNAFMVFSNEWRNKLAALYPADSNTQISVSGIRPGNTVNQTMVHHISLNDIEMSDDTLRRFWDLETIGIRETQDRAHTAKDIAIL
ncbi:uncharacterized protein LOC110830888 isoform X1 [Zootermopsis nevadensis]|uniref:uncharacterized protein LOC110830888 isoform X1 n=1 Tax=Zootermopsis nevadensis TaxID=136037 RepID=UPI000B8EA4E1|nr:uncharacterized protein LOC110830888 isoform X1 [Zootermopsis nevadensis]